MYLYCAKNDQFNMHILNICHFPGSVRASPTSKDPYILVLLILVGFKIRQQNNEAIVPPYVGSILSIHLINTLSILS